MAKQREWLKSVHPTYKFRRREWEANERRLRGGIHVLSELRRFDWETLESDTGMEQDATARLETKDLSTGAHLAAPGQHYAQRQAQALYLNFPDQFMGMLVGHLFRKRPTPGSGLNFGGLGEVGRERSRSAPSFAELVYYNTDGVGNDGSQWDSFWADVERWAGATGHRWLFVEASTKPGVTRADVFAGNRPYLRHLSPLAITDWDMDAGRLAWAIEQLPVRPAKVVDGKMKRETKGPVRLYVRAGYTGLDAQDSIAFSSGGWWTFDEHGEELTGEGMRGSWEKTNGEIPLWAHYYQRDKDYMSRPGTTELGNGAVAYMNVDSAASYDAWDAASSLQFLLGVTPQSFNVAMDKVRDGSKFIPIPATDDGAGGKTMPSVQDSAAGAVTATVFSGRLAAIRDTVRELSSAEASSTPDSSGLSKLAGFSEDKSPRLGLLASELETSQNIALHFLERRFGVGSPSAVVTWTRDFDLAPVLDSIERMFELERTSELRSPTLGARLMLQAGREIGVVNDDKDETVIEGEYKTAADARRRDAERSAALLGEFGRGPAENEPALDADGLPLPKADPAADPNVDPAKLADPTIPGTAQTIQTTEATVLNGAQISSAKDIVLAVASGQLPRDSGVAMLEVFFNLDHAKAEHIMGEAGKGTKTTPNQIPDNGKPEPTGGRPPFGGAPPADNPPEE